MANKKSFLKAGTRVKLKATGECGFIIYGWFDEYLHVNDYHIAFYGDSFPSMKPDKPPYVLRYAETSLIVLNQ